MLLGFLVQDDSAQRSSAASALSGGTLAPVVGAIERCLAFYVSAEAITDMSRESLVRLLVALREPGAGAAQILQL